MPSPYRRHCLHTIELQLLVGCQGPKGHYGRIISFFRYSTLTCIQLRWKSLQRLAETEFYKPQCRQQNKDINHQTSVKFSHMSPNPNPRTHMLHLHHDRDGYPEEGPVCCFELVVKGLPGAPYVEMSARNIYHHLS